MISSFFKPKSKKVQPLPPPLNGKRKESPTAKQSTSLSEYTASSNKRVKHQGRSATTVLSPDVTQLLSYLVDDETKVSSEDNATAPNDVKSWKSALERHCARPSFARLATFVAQQRKGSKPVYPPPEDTFAALNWTPLDHVKVVIVGQDPYHGPGQAHGLCFSVQKGVQIPPSLRNIYKELLNDDQIPTFSQRPTHGYLQRWAQQGVLMINNVLTVRKGEAHSHKKQGWEDFTDEIIRAVDRRSKERQDGKGVVFLLWGKPATEKAKIALGGNLSTSSRHTIIATSHPSPLGATKTKSPFLGSKCFSRANQALKECGQAEIDWRVDSVN